MLRNSQEPTVQLEYDAVEAQGARAGSCRLDRTPGDERMLVLAHELRSPLGAIASAVELMARQLAPLPQVGECAAVVRRQMAMVTAILRDLAGRGDSVAYTRDPTVDVRLCVEDAVESCQPLLRERRHDLAVEIPVGPVWWIGERSRLVRCIVNLLDNAAHYTSPGGHIVVGLHVSRGQLALSVTDNGVGLGGTAPHTIFRPRARVADSAMLHPDGHGIGLAVVDEIARAYGGRVEAASAGRGLGSTFTLLLPMSKALQASDVPGGRR
jgi:signal transduction histidine kinase